MSRVGVGAATNVKAQLSGWLFASAHGWNIPWFFAAPLPMLTPGNHHVAKLLDGWHQNFL